MSALHRYDDDQEPVMPTMYKMLGIGGIIAAAAVAAIGYGLYHHYLYTSHLLNYHS